MAAGVFSPKSLSPVLYLRSDVGAYTDAAIQFVAADQSCLKIDDGDQSGLDIGTDDQLVCGWVYCDSRPNTYNAVWYKTDGCVRAYVQSNGTLYVGLSSIGSVTSEEPVASTGVWHFIAAYADRSGNLTGFVDGEMVCSVDISASVSTSLGDGGKFTVGGRSDSDSFFFDGRIDSLMVFKAADLSAVASDIIEWAYNSGQGRLCEDITDEQKTAWGAVSGWEFGESGDMQTRYDSWGSNHLTPEYGDIIAPATFGSELLTNGNLDDWTGSDLDSWLDTASDGAITEETTEVHTAGGSSLKLTAGSSTDTRALQQVSVVSGNTYRISAWVRGDGTYSPRISVLAGSGPVLGPGTAEDTGVDGTEWQLVVYEWIADATESVWIRLYCPDTNGGVGYFDDVSVKQYTPGTLNGSFEDWADVDRSNQITNSYFTSDTTGWTAKNDGSLASVAGGVSGNCLEITNGSEPNGRAYQGFATTIGAIYRATYWHKQGTASTGGAAYIGTSAGTGQLAVQVLDSGDSSWTKYTTLFRATTTTTYISFLTGTATPGETRLIDSVEMVQLASNADDWVEEVFGGNYIISEDEDPDAGNHSLHLNWDAYNAGRFSQAGVLSVGTTYSITYRAKGPNASAQFSVSSGGGGTQIIKTLTTSFAEYSGMFTAGNSVLYMSPYSDQAGDYAFDSVTLQAATIEPAAGIARGQSQDANFGIEFDGDYLSGPGYDPGTGDVTVFGAFYLDRLPTATDANYFTILRTIGSDGSSYYGVQVNNEGRLWMGIGDSTSTAASARSLAGTLSPGNWYTFAGNFDRDGAVTGYLDGIEVLSGDISLVSADCDVQEVYIGRFPGSGVYYYRGKLDNIGIANRLITSDERTYLFNNGQWRQYAEIAEDQPDLADAIVGMWEGDDADDLGADSTANGIDLTTSGYPNTNSRHQLPRWPSRLLARSIRHWQTRHTIHTQ